MNTALNRYIRRAGLTQRELAKRLHIHPSTVSKIASGRGFYFSPALQTRIAYECGIQPEELNHAFGLPGGTTIRLIERSATTATTTETCVQTTSRLPGVKRTDTHATPARTERG